MSRKKRASGRTRVGETPPDDLGRCKGEELLDDAEVARRNLMGRLQQGAHAVTTPDEVEALFSS